MNALFAMLIGLCVNVCVCMFECTCVLTLESQEPLQKEGHILFNISLKTHSLFRKIEREEESWDPYHVIHIIIPCPCIIVKSA